MGETEAVAREPSAPVSLGETPDSASGSFLDVHSQRPAQLEHAC